MVNQELLHEYSDSIRRLKKQCTEAGIGENEFKHLYFESIKSLEKDEHTETDNRGLIRRHKYMIIVAVGTLLMLYNYRVIYSCLVCNLQEYIYPGLRLLRRLSIPFISLFPAITDLYHETCLVQNPFFTVTDMDCWPCSTVGSIREVFDPRPLMEQHTAPFMYETHQKIITIETLKDLYLKNKKLFDKESPKIITNDKNYLSPHEVFTDKITEDRNLFIWKLNSMNTARVLRQIIPRPKVVPKFGQSTERFIIVDSYQDSFHIPDTECSFTYLLMLSGSRTVELVPAKECSHQCKSIRINLKESYLLWYNWWYWRPVVQPAASNVTLIAHVGSYC